MAVKRRLQIESLTGGRVTKRRRGSNMPDPSGLLTAESGEEQANIQNRDINAEAAEGDSDGDSVQGFAGNSQTSSSSSDLDDTSDEMSSHDEGETSSTQMGKTSSSDKGDSSKEEEVIQNLPLSKKPTISALNPASDLCTRLSSFLPELRKANADLENSPEILTRRLDEVADDEEHYIEMDLGLGVLKEKRPATAQADGVKLADVYSTGSSEDSDSDTTEARDAAVDQMINGTALADLLRGKPPSIPKPSIQVVTGS